MTEHTCSPSTSTGHGPHDHMDGFLYGCRCGRVWRVAHDDERGPCMCVWLRVENR
jgi:hypothetical protein